MRWLMFLIVLSFIGCTNNDVKDAFNDRKEILFLFSNISLFRDDRTQTAILYTYKHGEKNSYAFSIKDGSYVIVRDSLSFSPDTVLRIAKQNPDYERQLSDKVELYFRKMDSLHINAVSSDFISQGIILKVYMKSKGILIYVADFSKVNNQEWVFYLKSMKKFDDHWYYAERDK